MDMEGDMGRPFTNAIGEIERLGRLPSGWDGHGGGTPHEQARREAVTFLETVEAKFGSLVPEPMVAPLSDGGIGLIWRIKNARGEREVAIVFLKQGNEYSVEDRHEGRSAVSGSDADLDFLVTNIIDQYVVA